VPPATGRPADGSTQRVLQLFAASRRCERRGLAPEVVGRLPPADLWRGAPGFCGRGTGQSAPKQQKINEGYFSQAHLLSSFEKITSLTSTPFAS
jgi:hypothetical protein